MFEDLSYNEAKHTYEIWTNPIYPKDKQLTIMGLTFEKGDIRQVLVTKDVVIPKLPSLGSESLHKIDEEFKKLESITYNDGKSKVPKDFVWLRNRKAISIYFVRNKFKEFMEITINPDIYVLETERLRHYDNWIYKKEQAEKHRLEQLQETANMLN
jgi:hypothetical protein